MADEKEDKKQKPGWGYKEGALQPEKPKDKPVPPIPPKKDTNKTTGKE